MGGALRELDGSDEGGQLEAVPMEDARLQETLRELHPPGQRKQRDQILLVGRDHDDRSQIRNAISLALSQFQVIEAVDAEEALRHFRSDMASRVAFIWADHDLPERVGGVGLARIVRGQTVNGQSLQPEKVGILRNVPIKLVVYASNVDEHDDHVASGIIQHVAVKPFHLPKMAENIRLAAMRMARRYS